MTTYEEWRVTGTWDGKPPIGGPIYIVWRTSEYDDAEDCARGWLVGATHEIWTDGPHLHKRTVTVTDWTEVDT